ncbi:LD-carboxypeptidase [Rivibacter subsaxonicus]|uniref:Muramoyltetrapeptide carboxypeptidase n=1 Tax=Rivibacter subsaxonicus TaxID=457575 RepID=A0A4Q7VP81_9BURK|nr:LD-carboxypeptidase [Rivibacter subsaxonicus]RZT98221.1 muramoyltetrapeptide carboxypeptidase [Rivibacter subsaxonicus]
MTSAAHDHHSHAHPHPEHGSAVDPAPQSLTIWSPAGVVAQPAALRRAARHLQKLGFAVDIDPAAAARSQRFAGDDDTRLAALHRIADAQPDVALGSRGGYGLTRLLDRIDWARVGRSVDAGTRWVGFSDHTALHNAALAHKAIGADAPMWAGPHACEDFGPAAGSSAVDDVTEACFVEAMHGELEAVGFREAAALRSEAGFDGLQANGTLWGGNLCVLVSLLGTPHFPRVRGGVLFLEDVSEHPYRVERMLLQLHQAGVLDAQKAIVLGAFSDWKRSPLDRGYTLKSAIEHLRGRTATPILAGLPFGHVPTKVCLPVGRKITLAVDRRDVLLHWG